MACPLVVAIPMTAAVMAVPHPSGEKKPGGVFRGGPVAYGFNFDAGSLKAPYQYIVTTNPHLQRAPEKAGTHHRALRAFGKAHIGKPLANLFAQSNFNNRKRSPIGGVG
jgi:hypothetical protein